jgi:hypothetical protein
MMGCCKYDDRARATRHCSICGIGLCGSCGYTHKIYENGEQRNLTYCNECFEMVKTGYLEDRNLNISAKNYLTDAEKLYIIDL